MTADELIDALGKIDAQLPPGAPAEVRLKLTKEAINRVCQFLEEIGHPSRTLNQIQRALVDVEHGILPALFTPAGPNRSDSSYLVILKMTAAAAMQQGMEMGIPKKEAAMIVAKAFDGVSSAWEVSQSRNGERLARQV